MKPFLLPLLFFGGILNPAWAAWPHLGSPEIAPSEELLPLQFDPEKNAVWTIDLPGPGSSTPLVWEDHVFVTCEIGDQNGVLCFDAEKGTERWRRQVGSLIVAKHRNASSANPSPATDGAHLVTYFKDTTVACFDLDGKSLWSVNLVQRYGEIDLWWDLGNTPVLTSAGLLLPVMHEGDSYLVTLDLKTGKEVWRQPRSYDCDKESAQSYTTPVVTQIEGVQTVLTLGADHLTAHLAETGKLLWEVGVNPNQEPVWRSIASPVVHQGVAIVPYGRGELLYGIQLGANATDESRLLWKIEGTGSDVPTPWVADGRAYILGDKGTVTCVDIQTGKLFWKENLPRGRSKYFCSPVLVGNQLLCCREDGAMYVCEVGEGLRVLGESDLDEQLIATPVLLGSDLLVRSRDRLYRFTRHE